MGSNSDPPPHHNPNTNTNHHIAGDHPPSDDEEDIRLQLTLGYTYNDEPPAAPNSILQNDSNIPQNDNDDSNNNGHVEPRLQPLVFRPLLPPPNNGPTTLYSEYQSFPQAPLPPPQNNLQSPPSSSTNPPRRQQARQPRSSSGGGGGGGSSSNLPIEKSPTINQPYPWATDKRCQIHPSVIIKSLGYISIKGRVKCRKCERSYEMAFDLHSKFMEVGGFLLEKKDELRHRAPEMWMNPVLPECIYCHQRNAVKPEIEGKKRNTNWLFLFLGQMLGCCTGEQLKYFCKHNGHHRTAAKDRLLYLAYLSICRQLDPNGPFNL